jgi:hypothetical protein
MTLEGEGEGERERGRERTHLFGYVVGCEPMLLNFPIELRRKDEGE